MSCVNIRHQTGMPCVVVIRLEQQFTSLLVQSGLWVGVDEQTAGRGGGGKYAEHAVMVSSKSVYVLPRMTDDWLRQLLVSPPEDGHELTISQ